MVFFVVVQYADGEATGIHKGGHSTAGPTVCMHAFDQVIKGRAGNEPLSVESGKTTGFVVA